MEPYGVYHEERTTFFFERNINAYVLFHRLRGCRFFKREIIANGNRPQFAIRICGRRSRHTQLWRNLYDAVSFLSFTAAYKILWIVYTQNDWKTDVSIIIIIENVTRVFPRCFGARSRVEANLRLRLATLRGYTLYACALRPFTFYARTRAAYPTSFFLSTYSPTTRSL